MRAPYAAVLVLRRIGTKAPMRTLRSGADEDRTAYPAGVPASRGR